MAAAFMEKGKKHQQNGRQHLITFTKGNLSNPTVVIACFFSSMRSIYLDNIAERTSCEIIQHKEYLHLKLLFVFTILQKNISQLCSLHFALNFVIAIFTAFRIQLKILN